MLSCSLSPQVSQNTERRKLKSDSVRKPLTCAVHVGSNSPESEAMNKSRGDYQEVLKIRSRLVAGAASESTGHAGKGNQNTDYSFQGEHGGNKCALVQFANSL